VPQTNNLAFGINILFIKVVGKGEHGQGGSRNVSNRQAETLFAGGLGGEGRESGSWRARRLKIRKIHQRKPIRRRGLNGTKGQILL